MKKLMSIAALVFIASSVFSQPSVAVARQLVRHDEPAPKPNPVVIVDNTRANTVTHEYYYANGHRYEKKPKHEQKAPQHNYVQPVVCAPVPMSPNSFAQLQGTIAHQAFESTKMQIFEQALAFNYFTTQQVCSLMNQFCFESAKLQVAKEAYPKTVDPANYYVVNNGFTFSSSVGELSNYLAMR